MHQVRQLLQYPNMTIIILPTCVMCRAILSFCHISPKCTFVGMHDMTVLSPGLWGEEYVRNAACSSESVQLLEVGGVLYIVLKPYIVQIALTQV